MTNEITNTGPAFIAGVLLVALALGLTGCAGGGKVRRRIDAINAAEACEAQHCRGEYTPECVDACWFRAAAHCYTDADCATVYGGQY